MRKSRAFTKSGEYTKYANVILDRVVGDISRLVTELRQITGKDITKKELEEIVNEGFSLVLMENFASKPKKPKLTPYQKECSYCGHTVEMGSLSTTRLGF
jgi:hypothetical protein